MCLTDTTGAVVEAFTVAAEHVAGSHTGEHLRDDPAGLAHLAGRVVVSIGDALRDHSIAAHAVRYVVAAPLPGIVRARQGTTGTRRQSRRAATSSVPAVIADHQRALISGGILAALTVSGVQPVAVTPADEDHDGQVLPEVLVGSRPREWVKLSPQRHPRGGSRVLEQAAWQVTLIPSVVAAVSPGAPTVPAPSTGVDVVTAPPTPAAAPVDGPTYRAALFAAISTLLASQVPPITSAHVLVAARTAVATVPRPADLAPATAERVATAYTASRAA
ncbi:hypothetical protein [Knoellia sp. LjRoot47]|uniref:hypothetical protein n=1 Tax=Knoellia sp. LjRoot47 TaxID=3342330 RepID=UPI003ECF6D48